MSRTKFYLPKFIALQVPILSAKPPEGQGWIHEIKQGGFRTLLMIAGGDDDCRWGGKNLTLV